MGFVSRDILLRAGAHIKKKAGLAVTLTTVGLISVACQNTGSQGTTVGSSTSSSGTTNGSSFFGGNGGSSTTTPTGGQVSFITIVKAVRSNFDPNAQLDLIGQNAEIGTQCPTVNDCRCVFDFTQSSGVIRQTEQTPSRVETNLLRCLFTSVDADAKAFKVSIKILLGNLTSNQLNVQVNAINPGLDPSISANYLQVQRFMCKDVLAPKGNDNAKTGFYRNGLVDPRLWAMSIAQNYYTTSLGLDYGATNRDNLNVKGFECPVVPNDPSDPLFDMTINSLAPIDIMSPSSTGLTSGDITIFPPDDNQLTNAETAASLNPCPTGNESTCEKFTVNRSDFYLATFRSGVFKVPVAMFHRVSNFRNPGTALDLTIDETKGPVVLGSPGAAGRDLTGFAAVPDANQNCPDPNQIKIPAGKKWAKLWRFRASFQPRTIQDVSNEDDIKDLFCTNRNQECQGTQVDTTAPTSSNSVCYNASLTATGPKLGFQPSATLDGTPNTQGFGNCSESGTAGGDGQGPGPSGTYGDIDDGNPTPPTNCKSINTVGNAPGAGTEVNCCTDLGMRISSNENLPANLTPGGNVCNPALIGRHDASSRSVAPHAGSTVGGLAQDVWLFGNGGRRPCIEADTDANGKLDPAISFPPPEANPYILSAKAIDAESKFDFIFVVTPISVTIEAMQDPQNNLVAKQYTPTRPLPNGAAGQSQPYFLASGSDNSAVAVERQSKFPLCVLQDAKQGAVAP